MSMFCYQCEQTARGTACTVNGVCGKKADTSNLQDLLTGKLITLASAAKGRNTVKTDIAMEEGLFTTITNVNFNNESIKAMCGEIDALIDDFGGAGQMDMNELWNSDEDVRSLKSLILLGLRGMAAYAHHARILGKTSDKVSSFFYKGMAALKEDIDTKQLLDLVMETGVVNLECMRLLDEANTAAYGNPVPVNVSCSIEAGPFIVISGHDLHDLKLLLEQTEGKGINIYTHGEMLPAHGYPGLKNTVI